MSTSTIRIDISELYREPRGVRLTPAGTVAVVDARRAIEAAASAVRSATDNGLSSWLDRSLLAAGVHVETVMRTAVSAAAPQLAAAGLGVAICPVSGARIQRRPITARERGRQLTRVAGRAAQRRCGAVISVGAVRASIR